jgi:4-hydroxy-2-oxoheptanedioate aldolase
MKSLKERIQAGETVHGSWLNLGSNVSAEIMGHAGFDWLLIDMEHGSGYEESMLRQLQVLASVPVTPIVRTSEASRGRIQQILDSGAHGIMFPQIKSSKEALDATQLMYYPPKGTRGMAKITRATQFGKTAQSYLDGLSKTLIGIIQIETVPAMNDLDAIAALDGVDVLFVGPTDLSVALDTFGQLHHPVFQQALKDVVAAANKYGKAAGVLMQSMNEYEMYANLGYRFLACGGDSFFIMSSANALAKSMKEKMKS